MITELMKHYHSVPRNAPYRPWFTSRAGEMITYEADTIDEAIAHIRSLAVGSKCMAAGIEEKSNGAWCEWLDTQSRDAWEYIKDPSLKTPRLGLVMEEAEQIRATETTK